MEKEDRKIFLYVIDFDIWYLFSTISKWRKIGIFKCWFLCSLDPSHKERD